MHIVIRKYQLLQLLEFLQLGKIGMADNIVKSNVLETDLLNGFLEIAIIKHLEGVTVDKEHSVAFDLSVT